MNAYQRETAYLSGIAIASILVVVFIFWPAPTPAYQQIITDESRWSKHVMHVLEDCANEQWTNSKSAKDFERDLAKCVVAERISI